MQRGEVIRYKDPVDLKIFGDAEFADQLNKKLNQLVEKSKSSSFDFELTDGKKISLFIEILLPEIHVILMGHQYDVYPLTRLAKEMDWRVTIVSNPLKINSTFAKAADKLLSREQFIDIPFDKYTAIILMSHDYKTDKQNLSKALETGVRYIAMLGPKVRAEKIITELGEEGNAVSVEDLQKIYAPAGLDVGALTPEEIALSLLAEIKAVFSKRQGGFLRARQTAIHDIN